jgi:predicted O-methyltransferase YrrM
MVDCIREFFKKDHKRPAGLDIYHDVFDAPLFFPLQRKAELIKMIQVARSIKPKVIYDIGSDKGGGLYHWCKCLPSITRVISCEVRGTPYAEEFEKNFPFINFNWLPMSSLDDTALSVVFQVTKQQKIDICFIDGDKTAFTEDFYNILPYMSSKGIIFMHDITDNPMPGDSFQEIRRHGYVTSEIIDRSDSLLAINREKEGIPSSGPYESWLRHWKGKSCGVGVIYLSGGN